MNLLIITSLTSDSAAEHYINGFLEDNHNVFVCSDRKHQLSSLQVYGSFSLSSVLLKTGFKPDLFLFIEGGSFKLFPRFDVDGKIPSAFIAIDSHMDIKKHQLLSKVFDYTFVAQEEFVQSIDSETEGYVSWLPLAFQGKEKDILVNKITFDISYVGSLDKKFHPKRFELLDLLNEKFKNIFIGTLPYKEMISQYAASKLVFNYSINNDLNMRCFEAIGSGSMLITNRLHNNGMDKIFREGIDFVVYEEHNFIETISQALQLSMSFREDRIKYVFENHRYVHRCRAILETTLNSHKGISIRSRDIDYLNIMMSLALFDGILFYFCKYLESLKLARFDSFLRGLIVIFFGFLRKFAVFYLFILSKISK